MASGARQPVGRLAPSPTGAQHLGNARTYLLAFWSARASGARLVLRIEDIDSPRVKPWANAQAIEDLHWLGIEWDEGPDVGGPHGPYVQTERVLLYQAALQRLMDKDLVYPCTCTRRDIQTASSAPHVGDEGPIYPGTCSHWRRGERLPEPGSYCWRFRSADEELHFVDQYRGRQSCNPKRDLGDFPITRKTGEAAYQLAVVVDDAAMEVTDVVRGDDLLPSTFRQLELFRAFDRIAPKYTHVPLVIGPDGRRLAKRHGDTRLASFREHGVRAEELVGWIASVSGIRISRNNAGLPELHQEVIARWNWSMLPAEPVVVEVGDAMLQRLKTKGAQNH